MSKPSFFLTASWRYLAMLNYEIDPAVLISRVPPGTELDSWQGRTYISMVGFLFLRTKVLGLPIPFHRDFEEVNLRFYVRRFDAQEQQWRRGVVFVKEIVPRRAIAWTARLVYGENYVYLPMGHRLAYNSNGAPASPDLVEYSWRTGRAWRRLGVRIVGAPQSMAPGSEEEFIAEHYWGYAIRRGRTVEYQVEHPAWRVWPAQESWFECDVAGLYGSEFVASLSGPPVSAFLAEGSPIVVRAGRQLPGNSEHRST